MKRLALSALPLLLCAWTQGIYFRTTDNQVDPTDYDAETSITANYPRTSAQGNSVGWSNSVSTRDRITTGDVRLRGIAFISNSAGVVSDYKILLPAPGNYNIRLAMGDASNAQNTRIRLYDDTTLIVDCNVVSSLGSFFDSNCAQWSGSVWPSANLILPYTFTTQNFIIRLGEQNVGGVGGNNSVIAAVEVSGSGAAASSSPPSLMLTGAGP